MNKNLKWALVLSGGGAKGLAHIGVLSALAEMGVPPPSLVAGTSMGAIIGGLYACGMDPAEIRRFALEEFDIAGYLDSFVFRISGPLGKVFQAGQILGTLATRPGIDSGQGLLRLFEKLTNNKNFDETAIPFRCNAVDLASGREEVFSSGSVALAMRASMSFPVFFEPLIIGDRCYADGGITDNIPVYIARDAGFRRVLAVDAGDFLAVKPEGLKTAPDILYRSLERAIHETEGLKKRNCLLLHASNGASPMDFEKKEELAALGERAVKESAEALGAFFSLGPRAFIKRRRIKECGIMERGEPA
jgi:NTE family protein